MLQLELVALVNLRNGSSRRLKLCAWRNDFRDLPHPCYAELKFGGEHFEFDGLFEFSFVSSGD